MRGWAREPVLAPPTDDPDFLLKIVLIGESGVGKTNLLAKFVRNDFQVDSKSTIGVEFAIATMRFEDKNVRAQIWDTAGQERYRAVTTAYYRGAVGAMLLYDLTSAVTFSALGKWLKELREADPKIVVMLVGNKCDLSDSRVIATEDGMDFAERENLLFIETSAKDSRNVKESFTRLIAAIVDRYSKTGFDDGGKGGAELSKGVRVGRSPDEESKGCCCF
jgi:small GTP-binding protein